MAGTHAVIGADVGEFAWVDHNYDLMLVGGNAATIDGLDELENRWRALWANANDLNRMSVHQAGNAELRVARARINTLRRNFTRNVFSLYAVNVLRPDIGSTSTNPRNIIRDLREEMADDSEEVKQNRVTTGTITADGDNTGDGTLLVYDEDPEFKDDNEAIQTQDMLAQCIRDVPHDGRTAGNELFQLHSNRHGPFGTAAVKWNVGSNENRLTNGAFDTWTVSDVPDTWTFTTDAGTKTEETSTIFRTGGSALKYVADGSATTLDMRQASSLFSGISAKPLLPLGVYAVTAQIQTGGSMSGTLTIQFKGTGYTPAASEKITITGVVASFTLSSFFVVLPKDIPSDFALQVLWNGTPTSSHIIYIDDMTVVQATALAPVGAKVVITRGATDYVSPEVQPDKFTWSFTNDYASILQTFFSRLTDKSDPDGDVWPDYVLPLPSAASASANYPDPS